LDRLTISIFVVEADVGPYQMLFRNQYKWHLSVLLFPNILSTHPLYATVAEQLIVPLRIRIDIAEEVIAQKIM